MRTRIVTWCVVRQKGRFTHHFFSRRRAAEDFFSHGDALFKVTWRSVEGGIKSIVASLANLAVPATRDGAKRIASMATWEPIQGD